MPWRLAGEPKQGVQERVGAALYGAPIARLVGTVAPAALRGNEEHARVGHEGEILGVMARARRHPLDLELEPRRRGLHGAHDAQRAARGLALRDRVDRHGELPLLRDALRERDALALEARQHSGIELPHLVEEDTAVRHDIGHAGADLDPPKVGHAPAAALVHDEPPRAQRVLGPGHESIAPPGHGRRAGVVGLASEDDPVPPVTHDALDDSDRDLRGLEMRALLDVQLDVGRERLRVAARLGRVVGVEAGPRHGVHQPLAVRGPEARDLLDVELASECPRPEETRVAPLLVAPGGDHERQARAPAGLVDGLEALEAGEDSQRAVERAAVGHRVDVRARDDRRPAVAETPESIARLVDPGAETRLLHSPQQPGAGLLVGRAPARARDATRVGAAPETGQRLEMGPETRQRDREWSSHGGPQYTAGASDGKPAFVCVLDTLRGRPVSWR